MIGKSEKIYGVGYISTGDIVTTDSILKEKLSFLKPGMSVIDIGCGVGGGIFHIAKNSGVDILGANLSVNMISLAIERSCSGLYDPEKKANVRFEISNINERDFPKDSFDAAYSRDVFIHVPDKLPLFKGSLIWSNREVYSSSQICSL